MTVAEPTIADLFRARDPTGVFGNALPGGAFARKDQLMVLLVWRGTVVELTHAQPTDIDKPCRQSRTSFLSEDLSIPVDR